ncbi:MAG TPA: carboxypeptidase-like regulatory domain-containing protein [Candidatus Sulfotelmatobacter sp.]|nr:carboxypeptidase-like regulatory domain-containing protein [Candidatus Sulfotelmatobacter sp.]
MRSAKALAFLCVYVLFATLVFAQTGTSSLRGIVSDPKGAVLPGATVTVTDKQNGFSRSTTTDGRGEYSFQQLPPSTYTVTVNGKGFAEVKQDGVQLLVGVPNTLNVGLQVQGQVVTVEVTGEATHVNTTDATMGNAFETKQIVELPFEGRNPVEILSLQAGVTYTSPTSGTNIDNMMDTRSGATNGGRSDQTNITLDGVDNNDQSNGFAFQGAVRSTLDSVEEFRVTTSNSNADAGRSSGAQVQLVTKSGTNGFHGSAYEFNRSNIGEANDWFNEQAQIGSGLKNIPPYLRRNTYGASLGGPIKKDRVFFFLNWERQKQNESTQTTRVVPSLNLRNGIVSYLCDIGDPNCVTSNTGANGASITVGPAAGQDPTQVLLATMTAPTLALLDPNCSASGTCPQGPGANPNVQGILSGYPTPNTNAVGDGFNYQGYTFAALTPLTLNTYIAKLDYNITQNGNHRLFLRGIMNGDRSDNAPQFPGMIANIAQTTVAKSLAVGYTAVLSSSLINTFHYGFVRQAVDQTGAGNVTYLELRGLDNPAGQGNNSYDVAVPVHNFIDDLTWTKGTHTFGFGANLRMIGNIKNSTLTSFSDAFINASWLDVSGVANKGKSLDPGATQFASYNLPLVDSGFNNSYDYPVTVLAGIITEVDKRYNFTTTGQTLPDGAPNLRHFVNHEFESYVQDSWRARPNLTITYGLRWTLLQPPYEKNGVQVAPTTSLNRWFKTRAQTQLLGQAFNQPITFDLSGQANNGDPYWQDDFKNFAPRLAIAYSPGFDSGFLGKLFGGPGKTSIRMGAGIYFDHFGEGIVNTFDQNGSFGLSTLLTNTGGVQDVDTAPRVGPTNPLYTLPPSLITPSPGASFPTQFPLTNFAVQWGLDDRLKTPYSYGFNLSFERELRHGFTLETAYVGRIGHRLLQQEDLGQPRDIVDPASGMDYFTATRGLDNAVLAGTAEANVTAIPYWENLFPSAAGPGGVAGCAGGAPGQPTATQNMFDLMSCGFVHNESTFQQIIDGVGGSACFPGCITLGGAVQNTPQYFASQFASLYAWRSIGNSAYNAGQLLLRHTMSHGLQFDLNYTYSHSLDMGSDAERIGDLGGPGDQILNAWSPRLQRATSTFDTTHQINSNWVYELPFGRGKAMTLGGGRVANAILGGWDLSGVLRWTSGFPVSIGNGAAWATNWDLSGYATQIGPNPVVQTTIVNGAPNLFKNRDVAILSYRQDFAGEVGNRNTVRGPGYFNTDMGLHKAFKIIEGQQLQFRWETYNAFNNVRFDALTANTGRDQSTSFGNFTRTLTIYRRMEFAVRYSF